jgi:alpha-L-rhamnosidase
LGDWVPVKSKSPVEFTSTAYYYADVVILANAAKLFHKGVDYANYSQLAEKIKNTFNQKYLDRATGNYDSGYQTELSVALYWKLVPPELIPKTAELLAKRVQADSVKLDVGLLGTKTILNALSENGYAELAYQLAARESEPSWGWWVKNGVTTLYENWPIDAKSDISENHIMFGEVSAWSYKGLGGIFPDTAQPGFRHIWLRPNIVAGLDSFSAVHESPYGIIGSAWRRASGQLTYTATIPSGSSATLRLVGPGGVREQQFGLTAGVWRFRYSNGLFQTE